MNRRQKTRLYFIVGILLTLGLAAALLLYALRQNINLFYTPTTALKAHPTEVIRLGGYVEAHSIHYTAKGDGVLFRITDHQHSIAVQYEGVLPTLFREGQGTVVTGTLIRPDFFVAYEVLAKHDEKYRPPILKDLPDAA